MLTIRPARPEVTATLAHICYEEFAAIANAHNFPPDLPNVETPPRLMTMMIGAPGMLAIVAEVDGEIAGSNFMSDDDTIFGIGPITVDPHRQNAGTGAALMRAVLAHAEEKRAAGVR